MKKTDFKIVFKLSVFHSYFEGDMCRCLQFIPAADTKELLNRFGLVLRNHVNGFTLYANSPSSLSDHLKYVKLVTGNSSFDFQIQSTDLLFNAFTDLPVDWVGQFIFESRDKTEAKKNGSIQLNQTLIPDKGNSSLGKLSVHFDDILKYAGERGYPDFYIQFDARPTQWQYFIINKSASSLTNPLISGNDEISFSGPSQVTIQSGEKALLFSSGENLIPLSEVPKYQFSLINKEPSAGGVLAKKQTTKVVFKGLPNPGLEGANIVNINGSKYLSSLMFVYV